MRRVRCRHVPEKDAIAYAMWCERPYKEAAEDHLRVTPNPVRLTPLSSKEAYLF